MTEQMNEAIVAVTPERASRIVGISARRLKRWDESGLLEAHRKRQLSDRNTVRLYDFSTLVDLRVIAALHEEGRSIQQIHRVLRHIRDSYNYAQPLQELVFAVVGKQIIFQHPDGTWEGDYKPWQIILIHVLQLEHARQHVRQAIGESRTGKQAGKVEKRRNVFGSAPVFEGTRVPVEAVQSFLKEGASVQRILEAYPNLTEADIRHARQTLQSA